MRKPGKAPERGRLRGRDPPLGRLLRWNSSGWPLEVGDPPYSGRWGNPMLLGMELPIGAVKSPPGTPGMLSGKVGPPEHNTCKLGSCLNIPQPRTKHVHGHGTGFLGVHFWVPRLADFGNTPGTITAPHLPVRDGALYQPACALNYGLDIVHRECAANSLVVQAAPWWHIHGRQVR